MDEAVDQAAREMEMLGDFGVWAFVIGTFLGVWGLWATYTHRNKKRAAIWYKDAVLLAESGSILPEEVTIQFGGKPITNLKKMNIVLWNAGNVTIDGNDIVPEDPLRVDFEDKFEDAIELFKVSLAKQSKPANGTKIYQLNVQEKEIRIGFTYLDPGQGCNLELLYQGELVRPVLYGTIKGIPHGFTDVVQQAKSFFYRAVRNFWNSYNLSTVAFATLVTTAYWLFRTRNRWQDGTSKLIDADDFFHEPTVFFTFIVLLVALHSLALYLSYYFMRRKLGPPDHLLV